MENINKPFLKAGWMLAYPIAYLYVWFFIFQFDDAIINTVAKTLLTITFIVWNELLLKGRNKGGKLRRTDIFWYSSLILTALLAEVSPSTEFALFILHIVVVYSVIVRSRGLLMGRTSEFIFADFFNAFLIQAFGNIISIFTVPTEFSSNKKRAGSIVIGILLVVILFPAFIIAMIILATLDEGFAEAARSIIELITPDAVFETILKLFLACPVCLYLFGLVNGYSKTDETSTRESGDKLSLTFDKLRAAPMIISRVLISVFAILYLVFFAFRGKYFFSAFSGKTAEGFLLSEYARKGFFELCGIMAINLFVFAVIRFLSLKEEYDSKINKILITILMSESLVFALSSFSKLILYYSVYGYTDQRALALWGTVFLAAGVVLVIVSLFAKKRNYVSIWVYIVMSTYLLMCILSAFNYFNGGYKNITEFNLKLSKDASRIEITYYDETNDLVIHKDTILPKDNGVIKANDIVFSEKPDRYYYYDVQIFFVDGTSSNVGDIFEQYEDTIIEIKDKEFEIR